MFGVASVLSFYFVFGIVFNVLLLLLLLENCCISFDNFKQVLKAPNIQGNPGVVTSLIQLYHCAYKIIMNYDDDDKVK